MNPLSAQVGMIRSSVSHVSREDGRVHHGDAPRAPNFQVGERLALNSTFVEVNRGDFYNDPVKDSEIRKHGFSPLIKTQSIPIRNGMKRTSSELQLREDEELADYRDYIMFSRIVNRMTLSQKEMVSRHLRLENHQCLAHVIRTRNGFTDDAGLPEDQKHRYLMPYKQLQSPQTTLLSSNDQQARAVSISGLVAMLAMDAADSPCVSDDDEDDAMFDLEL